MLSHLNLVYWSPYFETPPCQNLNTGFEFYRKNFQDHLNASKWRPEQTSVLQV
jgi:hypothetical protein